MTSSSFRIPDEDIRSILPIEPEHLNYIRQTLLNYRTNYHLHDSFGYNGSEMINWIIETCVTEIESPLKDTVQAICILLGYQYVQMCHNL